MWNDFNALIDEELEFLNFMINALERSSPKVKEGGLFRRDSSLGLRYYFRDKNIQGEKRGSRLLGEETHPEVIKIKQAKYNELLLKKLKNNKCLLESVKGKFDSYDIDAIDAEMETCYRDETGLVNKDPVFMSLKEWSKAPYKRNGISIPNECNTTCDGTKVRSKSEVIIHDCLRFLGVPFHYDADVNLRNEMGQRIYKNADFVMLRNVDEETSGPKYIILEHLGRLDDDTYFENNMHKLRLYVRNGYRLNDTLFITSDDENGFIDAHTIFELIKKSILPKVKLLLSHQQ